VSPSKEDVIRALYAYSTSDDVEGMIGLLAPGFELDVSRNVFNPAIWHGADGAREWLRQAREVWDTPTYEVIEIEDLGGDRAFSGITLRGAARASGLEMTLRQWHVWTIRDGLVAHCVHFNEEAQAREYAGLTPRS
jgi:ketosteroid isomerase-like protein